ncbi:MAG TPA: hypothetical protein VJK54_11245 [Chthoniobacterales bacterium]|nr:hypothetical protein [Chthoniobacterales bacterium]
MLILNINSNQKRQVILNHHLNALQERNSTGFQNELFQSQEQNRTNREIERAQTRLHANKHAKNVLNLLGNIMWIEMQKKIQPEIEKKIVEVRERIALIPGRIEEATEINRLAQEEVERVNNQFLMGGTRTTARETAEKAIADLEQVKEGQKIAEADLEQWQNVLTRLEKGVQENVRKFQEAQSKAQTTTKNSLSCWKETITSFEISAKYWQKSFETQSTQPPLAADYSLAATELEQAAEQSREAAEVYAKAIGEDKNFCKGNGWRSASNATQISAVCRIKAMEARSIRKEERAKEYAAVAEKLKRAAMSYLQTVQLLLEGKGEEQNILYSQARSFQSEGMSQKYRLQEVEAQEIGKEQIAAGYREAIKTFQKAADQYKLAAEAYTVQTENRQKEDSSSEENDAESYKKKGESFYAKAEYQAKKAERGGENHGNFLNTISFNSCF